MTNPTRNKILSSLDPLTSPSAADLLYIVEGSTNLSKKITYDNLRSLDVGVKNPVRAATTANITLSGEQTIDDIAVVTGDRVLVKDQTADRQNGIYIADDDSWTRAGDFNGSADVKKGSVVFVNEGTASADSFFHVSSADDPTIDVDSITFTLGFPSNVSNSVVTSTGSSTSRSLALRFSEFINLKDHGATGDGSTDDAAAFNTADPLGSVVYVPPGTYRVATPPPGLGAIYWFAQGAKVVPDGTGIWRPTGYKMIGNTEYYQKKSNYTSVNPTQPRAALLFATGQKVSAGETLTQAVSGATGVVAYEGYHNVALTTLWLHSVTGTFDTTNALTGSVSGALGVPASVTFGSYQNLDEAVQEQWSWVNGYGYQEPDTDGNYSGSQTAGKIPAGQTTLARTGSYQLYLSGSHSGMGDGYNQYSALAVTNHGQTPITTWGGQNSGGLFGGTCNASTNQVNLYGAGDVILFDGGKEDVSMLGHVSILKYTGTESGSYNIPRVNFLAIADNSAGKFLDAAYSMKGRYEVGMDLSAGTYNTTFALTVGQDHKIGFDATSYAGTIGKFSTQDAGDTWMVFDGTDLNVVVGNTAVLGMDAAGTVNFKKAGTAASVAANFSADKYMTMEVAGTVVYIPYSESTW